MNLLPFLFSLNFFFVQATRGFGGANNPVNECDIDPDICGNNAGCVDTPVGFDCRCDQGFVEAVRGCKGIVDSFTFCSYFI